MNERNLPDTSLAAYRSLTPEQLNKDYGKIISALKILHEATYEEIVNQLQWKDLSKCSRRLKEMEGMQIIYKPGCKKLTSRNRSAYVYKLVDNGQVSAQPEKLMKGETVSDISRKLVQKTLFDL